MVCFGFVRLNDRILFLVVYPSKLYLGRLKYYADLKFTILSENAVNENRQRPEVCHFPELFDVLIFFSRKYSF